MDIRLIGVGIQDGSRRLGCEMGPSAYRAAGIVKALEDLGHNVIDTGNITPTYQSKLHHPNKEIYHLPQVHDWIDVIAERAYQERMQGFPIFMGGDHALSAGSVVGMQRYALEIGKPLFVLWLDAHTDFHTLDSTKSGNLHGTPVAYLSGQKGFEGYYPALAHPVPLKNFCLFGIRSVDSDERIALNKTPITICDMRNIDEFGVSVLLRRFLERVEQAKGILHVSLDVDFLDPSVAPAVGTTVPGGATFREAHLIMELLSDSKLVSSLDLVELNPFLDERGKTATLMMDLAASLMGRRVIDRVTRSYNN
ncbi:arginase [Bartonella sp. HY329]|uniref:arginase n=1 Tax=unclassified Bartonella TaxID=2645622 RepID=UPI0021C95A73|nr:MULTISPECIES: arginase [unclassified Bartonella]UXM95138.1 arginase [Bartonella sp. HY329]UXN09461.1 arginase [Bartonella sp. HY328]